MFKIDKRGLRFSVGAKGVELRGMVGSSFEKTVIDIEDVRVNLDPRRFDLTASVILGPLHTRLTLWRDPFRDMPKDFDYRDIADETGL